MLPAFFAAIWMHRNIKGNNAVFSENKARVLPDGSRRLHLLCLCTKQSKLKVVFDGIYAERNVPCSRDRIGAWDLYALGETGFINKENVAFESTHLHNTEGDMTGEQAYLYRFTFEIPETAVSFIILQSPNVYVLSAVADCEAHRFTPACELYDSLEKRECDFKPTAKQKHKSSPLIAEKIVYKKMPPETSWYNYGEKEARGRQLTDVFCEKRADFISKFIKK